MSGAIGGSALDVLAIDGSGGPLYVYLTAFVPGSGPSGSLINGVFEILLYLGTIGTAYYFAVTPDPPAFEVAPDPPAFVVALGG